MRTKNSMQGKGGRLKMLLLLLPLVMCSGCLTTERLIAHPQFKSAALAAPDWTRDALETIADLERELESQ